VAVKAVKHFLETPNGLDEVVFVLFSDHGLKVYLEAASEALE
jgi:O-acetyl-ADP-ribose deacetylase (regulator of RNase III)